MCSGDFTLKHIKKNNKINKYMFHIYKSFKERES